MILDSHVYIGLLGAVFSLLNFATSRQIAWVSTACFALAWALRP
jgi:hypothetical protein